MVGSDREGSGAAIYGDGGWVGTWAFLILYSAFFRCGPSSCLRPEGEEGGREKEKDRDGGRSGETQERKQGGTNKTRGENKGVRCGREKEEGAVKTGLMEETLVDLITQFEQLETCMHSTCVVSH